MTKAKLEVQIAENHLDVWWSFQTQFRFWVDEAGKLHACAPHFDDIEWETDLTQPRVARPIEVHALRRVKEPWMALPRLRSDRIKDDEVLTAPKPQPASGSGSHRPGGPLTDKHTVDVCLNMILDSLLANPLQTKAQTIVESHRIAKELGMKVGSVAAVRANYTRGRYGDPEQQLQLRMSYLRRNAPLRQAAQRAT